MKTPRTLKALTSKLRARGFCVKTNLLGFVPSGTKVRHIWILGNTKRDGVGTHVWYLLGCAKRRRRAIAAAYKAGCELKPWRHKPCSA